MRDRYEQSPEEDPRAPCGQGTRLLGDAGPATGGCPESGIPTETAAPERPDGLPVGYDLFEAGRCSTSPTGKLTRLGSWLRVVAGFKEAMGLGWGKVIERAIPKVSSCVAWC